MSIKTTTMNMSKEQVAQALRYKGAYGLDEPQSGWCAYNIPIHSGFSSRQCRRKPKQTIGGYDFCTRHANTIIALAMEQPQP